jgi:meiotically up-regulated gene 157 (Mug157) protein
MKSKISRRSFIHTSTLAATGMLVPWNARTISYQSFTDRRPPEGKRNFTSSAVEKTIKKMRDRISDRELAWMFENCFPNTLDTTVHFTFHNNRPDTFVITGDIDAMWLRDSTAQVWPYLPLAMEDTNLQNLIAGVINRQTDCILIDPYANAFNNGPTGGGWENDLTDMKPELHERKWEIDSLCYPVRLAYHYWKTTQDIRWFDEKWNRAMHLVVKTFREQQRKENQGPYKFQRVTAWQTDTVAGAGYGNPIRPVGMICSIFRPSDDATIFPFLIPSNLFAIVSLRQLAEMQVKLFSNAVFARECESLANEIESAVLQYALHAHLDFGDIYAYEVDGFGNRIYMDDANIPSLLSLPYLGICERDDPKYQATRKFVLSDHNPYFFRGTDAEGIGGPHVGLHMIWPMGIIMRALTSNSDEEIHKCLYILKTTHAGTGFMHETFHMNDPQKFTRKWFAWANTLFGELIMKIHAERPHLLRS